MALIPKEEITKLNESSVVKEVAGSALEEIEVQSVAATINLAANSGQTSCTWQGHILDSTLDKLISKGYVVKDAGRARNTDVIIISWE